MSMGLFNKGGSKGSLEEKVKDNGAFSTLKKAFKVGVWGTVGLYFVGVTSLSMSLYNISSGGNVSYPGYDIPQLQQAKKKEKKVALIPISGAISSDGKEADSNILVSYIDQAVNSGVDGFIFEIDSPGGVVLPSKDIMERIKRLDQPKVALIRNVGASGAYWVASACDYIIADEVSNVGSIGVRLDHFDASELMKKLGIKYDPIKAGLHKTMGSPFESLSDEERKLLEGMVNNLHELFIKSVAQNRHMESEKIREVATGEVFLGKQSLELGLVDGLGNRATAAEWMYDSMKGSYDITVYRQSGGRGLFGMTASFGEAIGEGIGRVLLEYSIKQP